MGANGVAVGARKIYETKNLTIYIRHNPAQYRKVLRSYAVAMLLVQSAEKIVVAAAARSRLTPEDYYVMNRPGANRARVRIWTHTQAAKAAEPKDRTLSRSLDAGRSISYR